MRTRVALICAMLVVVSFFVAACATAPSGGSTLSQADMLTQAGFTLRTADTPRRITYVSSLPPQKVVQLNYQGKTLYVVSADPGTKQFYVGDEAAYQRYQQLSLQQNLSADRRAVSEQRWDPEYWTLYAASQGAGR